MIQDWKTYLRDNSNLTMFITTLMILIAVVNFFKRILLVIDLRKAPVLNDLLLNYFTPADFSIIIFLLTYGTIGYGLYRAFKVPDKLIFTAHTYTILIFLRIIFIKWFPLSPPAGIIPLKDVFLETTVYGGKPVLSDLFFSGHVSTILLFAFTEQSKKIKHLNFLSAACVGLLLLWQHVHYSIDIFITPLMAFIAVKCTEAFWKRI